MSLGNGNLFYIDIVKAKAALAGAAKLNRAHARLYHLICDVLPAWHGRPLSKRISNAIRAALPPDHTISYESGYVTIWVPGETEEPTYRNRFGFRLMQMPDTLEFDWHRTQADHALAYYAGAGPRLTAAAILADELDARVTSYNQALGALKAAYDGLGEFRHDIVDPKNRSTWGGL